MSIQDLQSTSRLTIRQKEIKLADLQTINLWMEEKGERERL